MSASDLETLALLHVAGMLDDDEAQRVAAAIAAEDRKLLEAIDRAEETLAALPLALEPRMPPAAVREALMARARGEASADRVRPLGSLRSLLSPLASPRRPLAVAVGLAAACVLAFWLGVQIESRSQAERIEVARTSEASWRERARLAEEQARLAVERTRAAESALRLLEVSSTDLRAQVAELRADLAELEARNATLLVVAEEERDAARRAEARATDLAERATALADRIAGLEARSVLAEGSGEAPAEGELRRVLELVRAPDSAMIQLVARDEGGRGSASVFWDRGLRSCYLHARGLQALADARRRALWIEYSSGRTVHVTDFEVDPQTGEAEAFAKLPVGLGEVVRTFVTREPPGDRSAPRGPVELVELRVEAGEGDPPFPSARRYRRRF